MNPVEVREIFERKGAIHTGHFRLSSGRHSDTYIQSQRVLGYPRLAASLGEAIAARCADRPFDTVLSPALGGILIGYAVAHAANARFVFAERADGVMTLRRGQTLQRGERVLIVEDVVTTGGSAAEVITLTEGAQAQVTGVAALVDRTAAPPPFHLEALMKVTVRNWDPGDCPRCAAGDPLESPGSRHASIP